MRNSHILRFCVYITSFLSSVNAFSVTFGTPTQCDPFSVSWTGGQAPFQILLTPFNQDLLNVSVSSSAFSSGKGSYSISQLPFASGTQFLLTMSDATGFGAGGTTTILTVGSPVANNNCNTTGSQNFYFSTSNSIQQCNQYTFFAYDNATLPVKITGLIPGGTPFMIYPVTTNSYSWAADVREGTNVLFFMTDSRPGVGQGGVDNIKQVAPSTDASCLNVNSPSSTTSNSASSQTSSQSAPSQSQSKSNSNTSTVGIIAGSAVGGVVALSLLIVLGIYCKRKPSRSSDITFSRQSRLQHKDDGCEVMVDGQVTQNFTHKTDRVSRPLHPQLQSQQHLRQISYTDSFAGSSSISSASRRMTAMGDQMASPNTFPDQRLPVGLSLPVHPGTHSHPTNTSVGNFAVNDPYNPFTQIRPSHLSPNIDDFAVHASDGHLYVSSASGQMPATASQASSPNNTFPYQTSPVHFAPPNQPGTLSHYPSASNFTVSDGASPLNSTQASRLSSDIDGVARHSGVGSSSMSSSGGRIATAAGATGTNAPPQIVMHVDSEDVPVAPDAQDVIELPPQYVERQLLVAEPASVPNQKPW